MKQILKQEIKLFFKLIINIFMFIKDMRVALTNDPEKCYGYAIYNLRHQKRRSYLTEEVIARSAEYSKRFSFMGLDKKRFELGEPAIATSALYSYTYALDIGERFELGEKIILTDLDITIKYARDVIKGRFVEAEELISKDPKTAFKYAKLITKSRFLLGEETIINSCYAGEYLKLILEKIDNKSIVID